MMKKILYRLIVVALLLVVGCSKRNIIPDDTLAKIFHDAFVVNAYIGEERIDLDSLQIYEPIFERYGYTAKDVVYTVGNFSRRKSARLGTVVERAISRLEEENKNYAKQVVILDTIRNVAVRTYTREMYKDTLIKVAKRADSVKLEIEISPAYQGEYNISYSYTCNDDLEKYQRNAEFYFRDYDGIRNGSSSVMLRNSGKVNRTLTARTNNKKLVLNLGKIKVSPDAYQEQINSKKKRKKIYLPKKQEFEIKNLKVVYTPNASTAIDSLFERYVNIKIFADGFLIKKDSLTLSPDSTRVSIPTPDNN